MIKKRAILVFLLSEADLYDYSLSMPNQFRFQKSILESVVGGASALDNPRLNIQSEEQARQFLEAYGFDLQLDEHRNQISSIFRRALGMFQEELLEPGQKVPEELSDPAKIQSVENLLIFASAPDNAPRDQRRLQLWACAILRVMHVYVHLRHDLFSAFSDDIQLQILKPIQDAIQDDPVAGAVTLGKSADFEGIRLHKFEVKPFKTTASSVIKLLARPEKVALTLLDKLGVRFVTRTVYDAFRVVRYLSEHHIISYPHIIPDQSNNTLFPLNLFLELMDELQTKGGNPSQSEIESMLDKKFVEAERRAEYLQKYNEFSGKEYKFIKFINRKLVTVSIGEGESRHAFRFFYPFEIQIMDHKTYINNLAGPMAHDEYKARQKRAARDRVFGGSLMPEETV